MNIFILWQGCRINFYHRSENYEMPVRFCLGHCINQVNIESFIHYSKKSKSWVGDIFLVPGIFLMVSCLAKMMFVDTAWHGMNVMMLALFKFINAVTTCKHDMSFRE